MASFHHALRQSLLDWYDVHARILPWRVSPQDRALGIAPDPYRVWLSEIMLQQTTITTVKPYFAKFVARFPTVHDMASAPLDDVLALWAGLGYYARARNMHKCAIAVSEAGGFPRTFASLSELPGIGPYTAAAIAAIAFDQPHVPVDGNVERVLSRLLKIEDALPGAKSVFRDAASGFEDAHRPGDFAQALMDLGSTVCTPRKPKCDLCPWQGSCALAGDTAVENYPRKTPKKTRPVRYGVAFVHINDEGILVQRRAQSGLLGGMLEVPGTIWREQAWEETDAFRDAPLSHQDWAVAPPVTHIFTHFELRLSVFTARSATPDNAQRVALADIDQVALPSVFMKVIKSALRV
jgi:A/G-specific adenine glycosylase